MPNELDPDDHENQPGDPSGATRRVQERSDRENAALRQENAVLKAGLPDLNDEQRAALIAVLGDDLSKESVQAKAQTLGFVKPADAGTTTEPTGEQATTLETGERISQVASESSPPTPPAAIAASWRDRLTQAPIGAMQVGGPLYQQVLAEIQAQPNLRMGSVDHDGTFVPTS